LGKDNAAVESMPESKTAGLARAPSGLI